MCRALPITSGEFCIGEPCIESRAWQLFRVPLPSHAHLPSLWPITYFFNLYKPKEVSLHYRDLIPSRVLKLFEIKDALKCHFALIARSDRDCLACWLALLDFGWNAIMWMYYGTTNCEILVTQLTKSSICKVFWQSAMDAHDTICMLPMPLHLTGWRHVNHTHWTSFDSIL